MAREIGSVYYTIGMKGAAEFAKSVEKARQSLLKLPESTSTGGTFSFDIQQLDSFGKDMDRIMRSSAATFRAELSRGLVNESNKLNAMLSQLPVGGRRHKAIQEIVDIRNASARPGQQSASASEIVRVMKNKEAFELKLDQPQRQRRSAESILRGTTGSGKFQEQDEYTKHLRAGLALLISQEGVQNKIKSAVLDSNSSISAAQQAYEASRKSAKDLLTLQDAITASSEKEKRARESVSRDQKNTRNASLDKDYSFYRNHNDRYSKESLKDNRAAYSEAKSSRVLRAESAAFASVESDIRVRMERLNALDDQTADPAKKLKLEIDQLAHKREVLADLVPLVEEYIQANNLTPKNTAPKPGSLEELEAIGRVLNESTDVGSDSQMHALGVQEHRMNKHIKSVVSGTRFGRFASIKADAEEQETEASGILSRNEINTSKGLKPIVNSDQKAMLESHVREMGKLKNASQAVIDIMRSTTAEEKKLAAARASGDKAGIAKHSNNLKKHTEDLKSAVRVVNEFNNSAHDASESSGRWNYQMQEVGYGIQDFVQVLSGGGGLGAALRASSNNFSQFFAAAGGSQAAVISTAVALGVLGISVAMDAIGDSTEKATGRIDDLIDRLRMLGELNAEYAKGPGIEFEAKMGEKVSLFDKTLDLSVQKDTTQKLMMEQTRKELTGKGMGPFGKNIDGSNNNESGETLSEVFSTIWTDMVTPFRAIGFGTQDNETTGSTAAQGVFDRIIKQTMQGTPGDKVVLPSELESSLNTKERELAKQLRKAGPKGDYTTSGVAKRLEEQLQLKYKAGVEITAEEKNYLIQLEKLSAQMKELEDIQGKSVAAYERRAKLISGGDRTMSEFSGEYASGRQSEYAKEFMESVKNRQDASTPEMKILAANQGKIAAEGFRSASGRGKFEGPASELAGVVSPALSEHQKTVASLNEIYMSDTASPEEKKTADEMIQKMKKELPGKAFVGMRSVASSYSPTQRIGESEEKYLKRIDSEINELNKATESLGKSAGMSESQLKELRDAIDSVGYAAKANVAKNKVIRETEIANGEMSGESGRRNEGMTRKINDIVQRRELAIIDADKEFEASGKATEDKKRRDAKKKDARVTAERELENIKRSERDLDIRQQGEQRSAEIDVTLGRKKSTHEQKINAINLKEQQAIATAKDEYEDSGQSPEDKAILDVRIAAERTRADRDRKTAEFERDELERAIQSRYSSDLVAGTMGRRSEAYFDKVNEAALNKSNETVKAEKDFEDSEQTDEDKDIMEQRKKAIEVKFNRKVRDAEREQESFIRKQNDDLKNNLLAGTTSKTSESYAKKMNDIAAEEVEAKKKADDEFEDSAGAARDAQIRDARKRAAEVKARRDTEEVTREEARFERKKKVDLKNDMLYGTAGWDEEDRKRKLNDIKSQEVESIAKAKGELDDGDISQEMYDAKVKAAKTVSSRAEQELKEDKASADRKRRHEAKNGSVAGNYGRRTEEYRNKISNIKFDRAEAEIAADIEYSKSNKNPEDEKQRDAKKKAAGVAADRSIEDAKRARDDAERNERLDFQNNLLTGTMTKKQEDFQAKRNEIEAKRVQTEIDADEEFNDNPDARDAKEMRDEKKRAARVVADREKKNVDREEADAKRQQESDDENTADVGKYDRISDEKHQKEMSDIVFAQKEEQIAAERELEDSNGTPDDQKRFDDRISAADTRAFRAEEDAKRRRDASDFRAQSALGSDIANLVGGRDAQRYQAKMTHVDRLSRIEGDENLSDDEKKAQANIESKLFGFEMEKIDRKNVSFTDVGSIWKTIQGSLKDDYSKKMGKEFSEYMDLAKDRGVKVRLAIGI